MKKVYESIMMGLTEAVKERERLPRHTVSIEPVKRYNAEEVRDIRRRTGFSQKMFAGYMGVSTKTVEAWETGTNRPSGTASRILNMLEMDTELIRKFPFVRESR